MALVLALTGCTQQLAQSSQSKWLKKRLTQPLHKTTLDQNAGPLRGTLKTSLAGYLESPAIGELSGLAASHKYRGLFWAINDSGNRPELFAVDRTGRHIQTFLLPERNVDWEDLASFEHNGESWLLVADTGDNFQHRSLSTLYLLREPDVVGLNESGDNLYQPSLYQPSGARSQLAQNAVVHSKLEFTYNDGPQNVESVAVASEENTIYLIAKRGARSSLYQLPLVVEASSQSATAELADQPAALVAQRVGNTTGITWDANDRWFERTLGSGLLLGPTALDINADNTLAVIANYRHLYLYRRSEAQTWSEALLVGPEIISSHRMAQSESVAFSSDSSYIVVGSEGRHAPVLIVH